VGWEDSGTLSFRPSDGDASLEKQNLLIGLALREVCPYYNLNVKQQYLGVRYCGMVRKLNGPEGGDITFSQRITCM
jgi:hypothetical protein